MTVLLEIVALMRFEPSRAMTSMPRLATWLIVLASISVVIVADPLPVKRRPGPVVEFEFVTVLPVTRPTIGVVAALARLMLIGDALPPVPGATFSPSIVRSRTP